MNWIHSINPLRRVSPKELMVRELEDARRDLLQAQTARDYANSMCSYQETRITRLRAMLEKEKSD